MEPIGIITKFYPFVDTETRRILDSVMNESETFRDFVYRLTDKVCTEDCPLPVVFLTMRIAGLIMEWTAVDRLTSKFENVDIIQPIVLGSLLARGMIDVYDDLISIADKQIEAGIDSWIAIGLVEYKTICGWVSGRYQDAIDFANDAERIASTQQDMDALLGASYLMRGMASYSLGKRESSKKDLERALKIGRRYNDQWVKAWSLMQLANWHKDQDATKAIELAIKAYHICEVMDDRLGKAEIMRHMGVISEILGEYEQSLESYLESIKGYQSLGSMSWDSGSGAARVCIALGDGEKAFRIAEDQLELMKRVGVQGAWPYRRMAQALILDGRLAEAADYVETSGEIAFKRGSELGLAAYYSIRGELDRAKGDVESAARMFKKAMKIREKYPFALNIIPNLFRLAETEVAMFFEDNQTEHLVNSHQWISRIDQIAHEQNLDSVVAHSALVRAELLIAEDHIEDARKSLEDALKLCDSARMKSIRKKLESRLERLDKKESRDIVAQEFLKLTQNITLPSIKGRNIPFDILGCIVMIQEGGVPVYSKYLDEQLKTDPAMVAGLISAVSTFTQELRTESRGQLHSIVHHDIAVLMEHGEFVTSALLANKDTYNARALLRQFLESFEQDFQDKLSHFDGEIASFGKADELFNTILVNRQI